MRAGTVMRIVALFVLYLLSVLPSSASTPEVHIVLEPHHVGDFFIVNITVDSGDEEIYAVEYELEFDNHILNAISQNKGDFLGDNTIVSKSRTDNEKGIVEYAETITGEGGVAGKGTLSTITFKAISAGECALRLNVTFISTSYEYLTAETVAHCTVVPTTEPSTTHSPATSTASTTSPAPQQASSDDAAPSPSATCSPSPHASPAAQIKPQTPQLSPTRTASPDNRSQSSDDLHVPTHPNATSVPSPQSSPSQSPSQSPSRSSPSQPSRQSPVGGAATATAVAVLASFLMKMRRSDGKARIYAFVLICMILPVYLLPLSEAPVTVIEAPVPVILVEQSQENVSAGQMFTVNITVDSGDEEIYAVEYELEFDNHILNAISQNKGDFLGDNTIVSKSRTDNEKGIVEYAETIIGGGGVKGRGTVASITFKALGRAGESSLILKNVSIINSDLVRLSTRVENGSVKVDAPISDFTVQGFVFCANGSPCMHPAVTVRNMNTSEEWAAEISHNSYRCDLRSGDDVIAGEVLMLVAMATDEEQMINKTLHTVTQSEIDSGCLRMNLTLSPVRHDVRILTNYSPPSGIKIERDGEEIAHGQNLTVGYEYHIGYMVENAGNIMEDVRITVKIAGISGEHIISAHNVTVDAGECYEEDIIWNTSSLSFAPGVYEIIVNASIQSDEHIYDERKREVMLVLPSCDIEISAIKINPRCNAVHGWIFRNQENEICAKIINNGSGNAENFNVSFMIEGSLLDKSFVKCLNAGDEKELCVTWAPLSLGTYELNVTADYPNDVNRRNNIMLMEIQVHDNGYKGKRYTGGEDIKTVLSYYGKLNISYSFGDSYHLKKMFWRSYEVNWSDDLVPDHAIVKAARLYFYYYADWTPSGIENYLTLYFNDFQTPIDAVYKDRVAFKNENNPSGVIVYDVTSHFNASGGNIARICNGYSSGGGAFIDGMFLMVIYELKSEVERVICVNEGYDMLRADENYCVNATEATAYAPFELAFLPDGHVRLIAVAPQADSGESELCFNDFSWRNMFHPAASATAASAKTITAEQPRIGICDVDVSEHMRSIGNIAMIRSRSDDMAASNVILVVDGSLIYDTGESPNPYPSIPGTFECVFTPFHNITVNAASVYPCNGTGGHIERIEIRNESWSASTEWNGYVGVWNEVRFDDKFTLIANHSYNLTMEVGSYPQIIHSSDDFVKEMGKIVCVFTDVNGIVHENWIPAMRLGVW